MLCQALLASAATALHQARRGALRELAAAHRGAQVALELMDCADRIETASRGFAILAAVVAAHVGASALADRIAAVLTGAGLPERWTPGLSFGVTLAAVAALVLIVGDWLPRRLAAMRPEAWAARVALPVRWLAVVGASPTRLLDAFIGRLLASRRTDVEPAHDVSEAEIRHLVAEGVEAGVIDRHERDMVNRVLDLDQRSVASLMHPRHEIVWLDATAPFSENLAIMRDAPYSRYPVKRGGEHEVLGILQVKSLVEALASGRPAELFGHLAPAIFVPESAPALSLLERFRDAAAPLALVVDEFGDIVGMVTPNNLLAAVFGRLAHPVDAHQAPFVQRADGSWLVDGRAPIEDLRELLGLMHLARDGEEDYHTVAGFVIARLGRIPSTGDHVVWAGWRFEVVDLDGARVDKILVERVSEPVDQAR